MKNEINNNFKYLLNVLRIFLIIWIVECALSFILYFVTTVFNHSIGKNIFIFDFLRLYCYYWLLIIIYYTQKKHEVNFFVKTNIITFIIGTIIFMIGTEESPILLLSSKFICQLLAIILTPILLKKVSKKLNPELDIYNEHPF